MPVLRISQVELKKLRDSLPAAQAYLRQALPRDRVDSSPFGVDRSTIRSFRGFRIIFTGGPLRRYNEWAARLLPGVEGLQTFGSKAKFERWYAEMLASLDKQFDGRLATHHRHKLADLFVKWCARYKSINSGIRNEMVQYAHCPLDSRSLQLLGELAPGTVLNRKPSMGDVLNEDAYLYAQEVVAEAAAHIPCTPLEFDVIAWNIRG